MKTLAYPTFERPSGWGRMALWDRMGWLRRSGIVADLLEAMAILKDVGEWPSEEELGMAGGRGLSPVDGASLPREARPSLPGEIWIARGSGSALALEEEAGGAEAPETLESPEVVKQAPPRGRGRRDRLNEFY